MLVHPDQAVQLIIKVIIPQCLSDCTFVSIPGVDPISAMHHNLSIISVLGLLATHMLAETEPLDIEAWVDDMDDFQCMDSFLAFPQCFHAAAV